MPDATRPRPRPRPTAAPVPAAAPARLPVSEFLYNKAGAASPFGDDVTFPLPANALTYRHPG